MSYVEKIEAVVKKPEPASKPAKAGGSRKPTPARKTAKKAKVKPKAAHAFDASTSFSKLKAILSQIAKGITAADQEDLTSESWHVFFQDLAPTVMAHILLDTKAIAQADLAKMIKTFNKRVKTA